MNWGSTKWILLAITLLPGAAFGGTILNCTQIENVSIAWEYGSMFRTEGLRGKVYDRGENPGKVVLIVEAKTATLKGNGGQVELVRWLPNVFLEETSGGTGVMWTILDAPKSSGKILFQQKAYTMVSPSGWMTAFQCE